MKPLQIAILTGLLSGSGAAQVVGVAPGAEAWTDTAPPTGWPHGVATVLANDRDRVLVAGTAADDLSLGTLAEQDAAVVCYSMRSGARLWEDLHGTAGKNDVPSDVVAGGGVGIVASIWLDFALQIGSRLRAYDLASGALLWERTFDPSEGDPVGSLALARGILVATRSDSPFVGSGITRIEAYDASSGALLWTTPGVSVAGVLGYTDLHCDGRIVYAAGVESNGGSSGPQFLEALALQTGARLWFETFGGTPVSGTVRIASDGGVVAAVRERAVSGESSLWAFDGATGAPLWDTQLPDHPDFRAFDIEAQDGRVAIAGTIEPFGAVVGSPALAMLDLATGGLAWYEDDGLDPAHERYTALEWAGSRLFVTGDGGFLSPETTFVTAECAPDAGTLLWFTADQVDGSVVELGRRQLAWFRDRLVTCGGIHPIQIAVQGSWFVRAQSTN